MNEITMTRNDFYALAECAILTFQGLSGAATTANVALGAPSLVEVLSSAGKVYAMSADDNNVTLRLKGEQER